MKAVFWLRLVGVMLIGGAVGYLWGGAGLVMSAGIGLIVASMR